MATYDLDDERARSLGLTRREQQVLQLVAEGMSGDEIAACLGMKASTVRYHLAGVRRKLGAQTTAQAIGEAISSGILRHRDT